MQSRLAEGVLAAVAATVLQPPHTHWQVAQVQSLVSQQKQPASQHSQQPRVTAAGMEHLYLLQVLAGVKK
ncbi:MAG TPA: hypothetical protein PKA06_00550 [Gemmatales bacterium]|nr:hypothetical protein [Gemmatales bacterium]